MPQTFIEEPTTPKRKAFIVMPITAALQPEEQHASRVACIRVRRAMTRVYLIAAAIKQAGSS